ncbi:MAG: DUF2797 domain-containing protein [Candidatus Nomurabacteria bacterium]|jgi:hypothetical protein|nr:DUF2797 domain-containing protein [Candidatus Nomurabacteria bacterium]
MLFTYFSFDKEGKPYYRLTSGEEITTHYIEFGTKLTLKFDTSQRFCTGGHDLGTYNSWACPEHAEVDKKYEQCKQCMDKTGFNPAFYHSSTISHQQEGYNQQPHNLYLAYFDDSNLKVGISHTRRGMSRLLEQGARAAIVLDEFASANVARQYEARLCRLRWINENIKLSRKIELIEATEFNAEHAAEVLTDAKQRIEAETSISFKGGKVENLNKYYGSTAGLSSLNDMSEQAIISGTVKACIGSLLVTQCGEDQLVMPLKKFVGYKVTISNEIVLVSLPLKQPSLF